MIMFIDMKWILSEKCVPSVAIAFRTYLTMSCSVCEGKRLSSIKNEKKTIVRQDSLKALKVIMLRN
jgi:hypothetical protein